MCGIAGFVTTNPTNHPRSVLERMTDVITHRGPDAGNHFDNGQVRLGHRRLSIVDLAAGHQPMFNEDDSVVIVYNGEIFNHSLIRNELEAAGHQYRTHCDTEAIIHAYEQWGIKSLDHFRGMFAFALWDSNKRQLLCARDRLGKKPFYYYFDGEVFVFGSEIKALLVHPAVSRRFDESVLSEYLAFGFTSHEKTFFQGIKKLMPGHTLTLDLSGPQATIRLQQYWKLPAPPRQPEQLSEGEWIAECRRRLEETVRMRLMSDVPLGMFLSGGVDSSALAALMTRMVNEQTGPKVKSFAVGYAETAYSELGYAKQVADKIGTDHHEVRVGMEEFFNSMPNLVWHEDEPISWPSSISLYYVSQIAAKKVRVVLTGEGSDEMFAGYSRYRLYRWNHDWMQRYGLVPGFLRQAVKGFVETSSLLPADLRRKIGHTFLARGGEVESLYLDNFYSGFPGKELETLFRLPALTPYDGFLRYWKEGEGLPFLSRMLYADMHTYLVELLMKQDQMSMACSIESRVPFLDHTFVEWSTRVPDSMKIRGKEGKYILKKAVEDLLPHEILYRPKMGFPTPLRDWLRHEKSEPLRKRLLRKDSLLANYIHGPAVEALLERHARGQEDATDRIWRLLNLDVWGDAVLAGDPQGLRESGLMPGHRPVPVG